MLGLGVPWGGCTLTLVSRECTHTPSLAMQGICLVLGSPGVAVPHRDPDPGDALLRPGGRLLLQPALQCSRCTDLPHHALQPTGNFTFKDFLGKVLLIIAAWYRHAEHETCTPSRPSSATY